MILTFLKKQIVPVISVLTVLLIIGLFSREINFSLDYIKYYVIAVSFILCLMFFICGFLLRNTKGNLRFTIEFIIVLILFLKDVVISIIEPSYPVFMIECYSIMVFQLIFARLYNIDG